MMKLSHIVIMTVVAFALVFTGCDSAGAGGGGSSGGSGSDGLPDGRCFRGPHGSGIDHRGR